MTEYTFKHAAEDAKSMIRQAMRAIDDMHTVAIQVGPRAFVIITVYVYTELTGDGMLVTTTWKVQRDSESKRLSQAEAIDELYCANQERDFMRGEL